MKTIKSFQLSCLARVFEAAGKPRLSLSALVGFDFAGKLLPEVEVWRLAAGELGPNAILDEALPKPVGEVLVHGRAFGAGGKPSTVCEVGLELGALKKKLYVVGERNWRGGSASEPQAFTELPITYDNAFGGEGFAANPVGKGLAPTPGPKGPVHFLPNIEDPRAVVASPSDRPAPAGFGPYPLTWPQRQAYVGTYDRPWVEARYPGLPDDFDARHWSTAPEDQRLRAGFHHGDEAFALTGMHPSRGRIEGRLPSLLARLFVAPTLAPDAPLTEVATRLDTVWLFPHLERGVLIFRGVVDVAEDDASDIGLLLGAVERLGEPRGLEHYRAVRAKRLDKDEGATEILRDTDLAPTALTAEELGGAEGVAMGAQLKSPGHWRRRAEKVIEAQKAHVRGGLARAREELQSRGHSPDAIPADPFPPPAPRSSFALDDLAATMSKITAQAEAQRQEAEAKQVEAMEKARALCAARGVDFDAHVAASKLEQSGPPRFRAAAELERLRDQVQLFKNAGRDVSKVEVELQDPRLATGLAEAESHLREVYRRTAHLQTPAPRLFGDAALAARDLASAASSERTGLAWRDLTGADLRGLSFDGMDLSFAHLESADLRGASLVGADLTHAVLARADLSGADLSSAKLGHANLGEANLAGSRLTGADLTGAILAKATLTDAVGTRATLIEADLDGATFQGTDLSGATLTNLNLIKVDLRGLRADGADLSGSNLIECDLDGVSLVGARLQRVVFVGCRAEGLKLADAELGGLCVTMASNLSGSDFSRAKLVDSNLRDTSLSGCDFSHADLDRADLSGAELSGARFYRATAREARFVRANLTGADLTSINLLRAILQSARIDGANFKGANLFRADLWRAHGDDKTSFAHANVTQARFRGRAGGLGAPPMTRGT